MVALGLPRDRTLRVSLPEATIEDDEATRSRPTSSLFLDAFRDDYPRHTFTDLVRLANVDAVVRRALTGHVTEERQRHDSTVGMDEKRAAGTKHSETTSAGSG